MVNHFNNKTTRDLSDSEVAAVLEAKKILEKAFGKNIFSVSLNPDKDTTTNVHNVSFTFDVRTNRKGEQHDRTKEERR